MGKYWQSRLESLYYRAVFQVVSVVGRDARSILDVGSGDTSYIKWFGWIDRKVQVSPKFKEQLEGVERISADFFEWEPGERFDVTICLQVLEHVRNAAAFCERLKATTSHLVISVPYKWRAGSAKNHVHDPVDEEKLGAWMKVPANYHFIVPEPFGARRLIAYYDFENGPSHRIPREISKQAIADKAQYLR